MALTAGERLILIRVKVERAKKHFSDFEAQAEAFREAYTYVVGSNENPQKRQALNYFTRLPIFRFELLAVAGDVVHNLRSSLDHLAHQLVEVGTAGAKPSRDTSFPIFVSADEYERGKARKVEGMREEAKKRIDQVKPYKGGNDTLWRLHEANNIDKHRFLITIGEDYLLEGEGFEGQYWRKASHPLFRGIFGPEMNQQMEITVAETLSETEIAEGQPFFQFLHEAVNFVADLVEAFGPLLE